MRYSFLTALGVGVVAVFAAAALPKTGLADAILTPPPAATPRINGPTVFGVRPGHPLRYSVPATGERPMRFSADALPTGVTLDPETGRMSGTLQAAGDFPVTLHATNARGTASKPFKIVVGEKIGLTPAMGWNSYNCFGIRVTQDLTLRAAKQIVALGLDRHGWTYVNMDNGWQGWTRDPQTRAIRPDSQRFPDIKAMVDQIHATGLKAGIYHTPWTISYGGRLGGTSETEDGNWGPAKEKKGPRNAKKLPSAVGKFRFVGPDAKQFADWGFDYLKYDWGPVEAFEAKEMADALRGTGRDLLLSLSNNAAKNLFGVIGEVSPHAQSWRTTTDISDVWGRVAFDIGFGQDKWAPHCRPGHFNDCDMLVIGHVGGWSGKPPRPTRLKPDEQFSHVSLWCLLASPLLIGCDLEQIDPFTLSLLTNDEVLDVNQDALCKQATKVGGSGDAKVYAKPMEDGSLAVGLFNTGPGPTKISAEWSDLGVRGKWRVRELWRQKDLGVFDERFAADVNSHGVVMVRLFRVP